MRIARGVGFGAAAGLLFLVFVIVAITKIGSEYWFGYFAMVVYGLGALACALTARHDLGRATRRELASRPLKGSFALAAVALTVFAVRSVVAASTRRGLHPGGFRWFELVFVAIDLAGAFGCVVAARRREPQRPVTSRYG